MTHRLCWMPLAPEVNRFQCEVRRDQRVLPLTSAQQQSQHGAVISNASQDLRLRCGATPPARTSPLAARGGHPADLLNQRFFAKRHSEPL